MEVHKPRDSAAERGSDRADKQGGCACGVDTAQRHKPAGGKNDEKAQPAKMMRKNNRHSRNGY